MDIIGDGTAEHFKDLVAVDQIAQQDANVEKSSGNGSSPGRSESPQVAAPPPVTQSLSLPSSAMTSWCSSWSESSIEMRALVSC